MSCLLTPITAFQSTNLNSRIDSYSRLADRIVRMLGAPLISVETHQDQIFEAISISCEMFTKFAGYSKEYLVFDSALYEKGKGIRLDYLYTLSNTNLTMEQVDKHTTLSTSTSPYVNDHDPVYVTLSTIPGSYFSSSSSLSAIFSDDLRANQILDKEVRDLIITHNASLSSLFLQSDIQKYSFRGEKEALPNAPINKMFDYDLMDYRRVIAVTDFEEGSTSGINTLFTIEQTLAQQTYFSYAMGNYGFDLVSWYTLKEWLELREKLLSTRRSFDFDDRTQYLRMYPEPNNSTRFYGVIACYVERPIRDIIKEIWVYKYTLAQIKVLVGTIRGKIPVSMFGGQLFNANLLEQGLGEMKELEQQLFTASAGYGDSDPAIFLIG
jgi:hypothetical protein